MRALKILNKKTLKWFLLNHANSKFINGMIQIRFAGMYAQCLLKDWHTLENTPPTGLAIQCLDVCNAKCIFCAYQFYRHTGKIISMETYEKAVRDFSKMGGVGVTFSALVGEPLLDPYLFERIKFANSNCLSTFMFTNGIMLNEKTIESLFESHVKSLAISFSDFNENLYNKIFGVDKYFSTLQGISALLRKNSALGEPIKINLELVASQTLEQLFSSDDFKQYIKPYIKIDQIGIRRGLDNWGGSIQEKMPGRLFVRDPPFFKRRPCLQTLSSPTVMPTGDIRLCECRFIGTPLDELTIGNINSASLEELWFGNKAKAIRRRFTEGNLPEVCKKCTMYVPA